MRRVFSITASLIALLLSLPAAQAQTPVASPEAMTLEGLEYVAARQYAPDPSSPITAEDEGLYVLSVRAYAFDSEEHANAGWESTMESTAIESEIPMDSDKVEFEEQEIDDLGDRAWATIISAEIPDGDTGYFRLLYIQEGSMLYTVNAIAGSAEATLITDEIAREIVSREPGEGSPEFRADGTSSGGLWDVIPATGDEVLGGNIAFADTEYRGED